MAIHLPYKKLVSILIYQQKGLERLNLALSETLEILKEAPNLEIILKESNN